MLPNPEQEFEIVDTRVHRKAGEAETYSVNGHGVSKAVHDHASKLRGKITSWTELHRLAGESLDE